ncbi:hypothetical protein C8R44DRAFT_329738 [Mycena epipterygia]|nr:hypothetical protein C8R44DRAFT_329738 [Mycena epipterygia]
MPAQPRIACSSIDITPAVCDEAISHGVSMIVSYHTPILSGWTSLTLATPLQGTLLRCAESRSTAPKVFCTVFSVASTTGWQNVSGLARKRSPVWRRCRRPKRLAAMGVL